MRRIVALLALALFCAAPAAAEVILETASRVPSFGGPTLNATQFIATRLTLSEPTFIVSAGGNVLGNNTTIFVAIVRAAGPAALPPATLAAADIVASGVLKPGVQATDLFAPINLMVPTGSYFVIFGSGQFGATGTGGIVQNQALIGTPEFFIRRSTGAWDSIAASLRIVVTGLDRTHGELADALSTQLIKTATQASVDALSSQVAKEATLAGVATQLTNQMTGVANAVSGINLSTSFLDQPVSSRATQASVDAVTQKLATLEDTPDDVKLLLQIQIEKALSEGTTIALFMRPQSAGGHLEFVRQIVDEALTSLQSLGRDMSNARQDLSKGDAALASGDYRAAYGYFAKAYAYTTK